MKALSDEKVLVAIETMFVEAGDWFFMIRRKYVGCTFPSEWADSFGSVVVFASRTPTRRQLLQVMVNISSLSILSHRLCPNSFFNTF